MKVLEQYLAGAGSVTAENAWEHVYRCLLWMNEPAGLAHIYDSNHMQPGGNFHSRAAKFTELLCQHWGIKPVELPSHIDVLFRGCVTELRRQKKPLADPEIESELIQALTNLFQTNGVTPEQARELARNAEALSRDYFTIGNKRKNALGEGFEDLLYLLLRRVSRVPEDKIALRHAVSKLPGFRKTPAAVSARRGERQPHPDIAILESGVTHIITTAKWSMRQDRETQFHAEFSAYQLNKVQPTELEFALITNEFDVARLNNVARAIPGGAGGYVFHTIYHINPDLLVKAQGDRIGKVQHWIGAGKIQSLADFLRKMREDFGS
jgi:hypothetical protein